MNAPTSPYAFGKALSAGKDLGPDELARLHVDHLVALKTQLSAPPPEKTDDLLDRRVAEELTYTRRLLESVEAELERRSCGGTAIARVEEAERLIGDLANVVEAKNRCDGVARVGDPQLKRRLLRRDIEGTSGVCERGSEGVPASASDA